MSHSVLVVEDEVSMARLIESALTELGFRVTLASNGQDGLAQATGQDALVVDVMMPGMDGFEMVRRLRETDNRTPVLFLTAKSATHDLVAGFESGGDDYLVKPFVLAELVARLKSLIRRSLASRNELVLGELHMDCERRLVRVADRYIDLSATEFSLLQVFMLRPGQVLGKQFLLNEVWQRDGWDDNLVEVYVSYLRKKLEAMGRKRILHTLRGQGYMLDNSDA